MKLKSSVSTITYEGVGTFIFDDFLSETIFIELDVEDFFIALHDQVLNIDCLANILVKSIDCEYQDALLAAKNTLTSLQQKQLVES